MNIYYVYMYRHPDTLVPFYVGYGKNDRCNDHLNEAKNTSKNSHKLNKIRKILSENKEPVIQIINSNISKKEACELEEFLIEIIGRSDLNKGTLTNLTKGGDGNRDWTPALRIAMSERNKNYINVKDPNTGKKFKVHKDDPRWINRELVGQNLNEVNSNKNGKLNGYIQAKDPKTGKAFRIKADDPRWNSGELVGINKDKPAHLNTIAAAKAQKGIPKTKEHNKKNSDAVKLLKWYCDFNNGIVRRFKEGEQPKHYIRVSGPHKKIPI